MMSERLLTALEYRGYCTLSCDTGCRGMHMVTTLLLGPPRMFESDKRPPEHTASIRTRRGDRQRQRDQWRSGGMFLVLLLLVGMALSPIAHAQSVPVVDGKVPLWWDEVTTDVGGNPVTDVAGYRLYSREMGTTPWTPGPEMPDKTLTTGTVTNLTPGTTYEFHVTAYDTAGNESIPSNILSNIFIEPSVDIAPPPPAVITKCEKLLTLSNGTTLAFPCLVSTPP